MMFHNTEKAGTRHGNAPQILFGARTSTPKWLKKAAFVFLLHKLVFLFHVEQRWSRSRSGGVDSGQSLHIGLMQEPESIF